jgi:hypothetical protein
MSFRINRYTSRFMPLVPNWIGTETGNSKLENRDSEKCEKTRFEATTLLKTKEVDLVRTQIRTQLKPAFSHQRGRFRAFAMVLSGPVNSTRDGTSRFSTGGTRLVTEGLNERSLAGASGLPANHVTSPFISFPFRPSCFWRSSGLFLASKRRGQRQTRKAAERIHDGSSESSNGSMTRWLNHSMEAKHP